MLNTRLWSLAALAGVAMAIGSRPCAASDAPYLQAYNAIKALEGRFPIPEPTADASVGTFDVTAGTFTGLKTFRQVIYQPGKDEPTVYTRPATCTVNAVGARLKFSAVHGAASGAVTPTVGASGPGPRVTFSVPAGGSVTVDVGRATSVDWSIGGGGHGYHDTLKISRPRIIGAGAFTIPALPVALVYEPPSVGGVPSTQTYTVSNSVGTAISMEFAQENSTTSDADPAKFNTVAGLSSTAKNLGDLLHQIGDDGGGNEIKGIGDALGDVSKLLGSASASDTTDNIKSSVSQQEMVVTLTQSITPNRNLGPGKGDVIVVLLNARLVWLAEDGNLTVALLGFDGRGDWVVQDLRTNPGQFPVDADTIQQLLNLDPFVKGAHIVPPGPRFTTEPYESVDGAQVQETLSHTVTQTDISTASDSHIHLENYEAGWLSFLGVGVDQTQQLTTKVTTSNSQTVSQGMTTSATFTLSANSLTKFNVYYDSIFGTFAITLPDPLDSIRVPLGNVNRLFAP